METLLSTALAVISAGASIVVAQQRLDSVHSYSDGQAADRLGTESFAGGMKDAAPGFATKVSKWALNEHGEEAIDLFLDFRNVVRRGNVAEILRVLRVANSLGDGDLRIYGQNQSSMYIAESASLALLKAIVSGTLANVGSYVQQPFVSQLSMALSRIDRDTLQRTIDTICVPIMRPTRRGDNQNRLTAPEIEGICAEGRALQLLAASGHDELVAIYSERILFVVEYGAVNSVDRACRSIRALCETARYRVALEAVYGTYVARHIETLDPRFQQETNFPMIGFSRPLHTQSLFFWRMFEGTTLPLAPFAGYMLGLARVSLRVLLRLNIDPAFILRKVVTTASGHCVPDPSLQAFLDRCTGERKDLMLRVLASEHVDTHALRTLFLHWKHADDIVIDSTIDPRFVIYPQTPNRSVYILCMDTDPIVANKRFARDQIDRSSKQWVLAAGKSSRLIRDPCDFTIELDHLALSGASELCNTVRNFASAPKAVGSSLTVALRRLYLVALDETTILRALGVTDGVDNVQIDATPASSYDDRDAEHADLQSQLKLLARFTRAIKRHGQILAFKSIPEADDAPIGSSSRRIPPSRIDADFRPGARALLSHDIPNDVGPDRSYIEIEVRNVDGHVLYDQTHMVTGREVFVILGVPIAFDALSWRNKRGRKDAEIA